MRGQIHFKTLSFSELQETLAGGGYPRYRATQLFQWVYGKHAETFADMTNIAKSDRERFADLFILDSLRMLEEERSADGTRKYLFGLDDGHTVESVLIPDEDRQTVCISSQVGCRQACAFCLTGAHGFVRNLLAWEIVDQVLTVSRRLQRDAGAGITNIVLMGMGEPLDNFNEVLRALAVITSGAALEISPRRVTLSTAGLVPQIDRLGSSGARVNLAVSLNASSDAVRDRIMPVNRRWPLTELIAACRRYPLEPRRRITFEYVMLKNINDADEDARRLASLLAGIRCKVNLIPFNPFPGCGLERSSDAVVRRFQRVLLDRHITAPVRESRGGDISAACGQLRERRTQSASSRPTLSRQ